MILILTASETRFDFVMGAFPPLKQVIQKRRYRQRILYLQFLPLYNHGQRKTAVINRGKPTADIAIKLPKAGNHYPVVAHPGHDLRHRMGEVG